MMVWVARGENVPMWPRGRAAIRSYWVRGRREREVANKDCRRLVAETALGLFIEHWPASPWIPAANQLTAKEEALTNGAARRGVSE